MNKLQIIAGSCSFEPNDAMNQADFLINHGVTHMRAMLFKPRTSPDSFQGIGLDGVKKLADIKEKYPQMVFVAEVMSERHVNFFLHHNINPIVYQVGSRNAQNYELLKYLGAMTGITVLYKRGMAQTIQEYIEGSKYLNPLNNNIWMCLRGIKTFEIETRNTSDIDAICVLKERFAYAKDLRYKIFFDPSHATGHRQYVASMALSAVIAGVDGLEIEIHSNPDEAVSDGKQTIDFKEMEELLEKINKLHIAFSPL